MKQRPLWKKALNPAALSAIFIAVSSGIAYAQNPIEIQNPIQARSFSELITTLATDVRIIATPLAVVAILITGFRFLVAASKGDEPGLKKARESLIWVIAGTAIVVAATILAEAIVNFATNL